MSVFVRPFAMVSVDGKPVGQTPLPGLELSAGRHTIELVNDKLRRRARVVVTVRPGDNPELRRDFTN
jgi:serine/threonine-protein kinase